MKDKNFTVTVSETGAVTRNGQLANAHIHALRQSQCDLKRQYGAVMDAASAANRKATDNERAQMDAITREVETLAQSIVFAEREQDLERTRGTSGAPSLVARPRGRAYAEMFAGRVPMDAGGFNSAEEFLATLHSGRADARLVAAYSPQLMATATKGVPSDGGFSVPSEFFRQWLDSSLENEIVRSRADVRPMLSSTASAAAWDDGDHSSTLYGGFTGEWLGEASDMTPQTAKMRLINLNARKLAILARVSNELIADGVSFEEQLGQAITRALGWFLDSAFLTGNGAAQPLGILNAACTITVAKQSGQAAATIQYENLTKMFARLHPSSYPTAVWVCNTTAIPQLLQLSVSIGTAGAQIPVLSESNGTWRILTLPVIFTEKVPALGTVGDIMLVDCSKYVIGLRADFVLAKSMHAGFASDTSYYRGIIRVDGQPALSAPITPNHGDTLSPFVTLQTRA